MDVGYNFEVMLPDMAEISPVARLATYFRDGARRAHLLHVPHSGAFQLTITFT